MALGIVGGKKRGVLDVPRVDALTQKRPQGRGAFGHFDTHAGFKLFRRRGAKDRRRDPGDRGDRPAHRGRCVSREGEAQQQSAQGRAFDDPTYAPTRFLLNCSCITTQCDKPESA